MPNKGFTLIELLVAMTILAVLAVIGLTLFNDSQKAARDTKRRSDLDAIASALEQSFNPYNRSYPVPRDEMFQSVIPTDPKNNALYKYNYNTTDNSGVNSSSSNLPGSNFRTYIICAKLENANGNAVDINGTKAAGTNAIYYCRKNLQ